MRRKLHCRNRLSAITFAMKSERRVFVHNMLLRIYLKMQNFGDDETGQDLIEYALVAALIAVTSIAMLRKVGTAVNVVFSSISSAL